MNIAAATLHVLSDLLGSAGGDRRGARHPVHRLDADRSAAVAARVRADRAQRLVARAPVGAHPDGRLAGLAGHRSSCAARSSSVFPRFAMFTTSMPGWSGRTTPC